MPSWLDRAAYPFSSHWFDTGEGRMHYVDEGAGPPVVLFHGNPTWSFLYRHVIQHLAPRYRCIAPDYLGFGLSDKPAGFSYRPEDHARHVHALLDGLGLEGATLVVQDWGGPIGLSYAVERPERVRRLVIMNTWMWAVDDDPRFALFSRILGNPLARLLIEQFNLFARVIMPMAYADRARLTPAIHRQYLAPLATPADRTGSAVFPRAILGSTAWLADLWRRRDCLAGKDALIVWGVKDPAFRKPELERWMGLLPEAEVHRQPAGHYVQEELGPELGTLVEAFLARTD